MADAKKTLITMMMLGAMAGGEFSKEPVDFDMMEQNEPEEKEDTDGTD